MNRRHQTGSLTASVVAVFLGIASATHPAVGQGGSPPAVGETPPPLSLEDLGGDLHSLEEIVGEGPLVLIFFRGAW